MTLVIEDEETVRKIKQLAADLRVSPEEAVKRVVHGMVTTDTQSILSPEVIAKRRKAIREAQEWFAAHRDPNDRRTSDEIIGYNQHGLFD